MQVEREFNRRDERPENGDASMGRGRWSRWGVQPHDCCTLELGFYRFDIKPGPRVGAYAGEWRATSHTRSLGGFPSFEAAAEACEAEARQLVEAAIARGETSGDMVLVLDHWKQYLALPRRLRSRRSSGRRR